MKLLAKLALALLWVIFLLSACGKPTTGIQGKVVLATCTGETIATECTAQSVYAATLEIYNDKVVKIKTIRTQGDGTFVVALKAGTYFIHPLPETKGKFPQAADFKVIVSQGKLTDLTIYYDTGERPAATASP